MGSGNSMRRVEGAAPMLFDPEDPTSQQPANSHDDPLHTQIGSWTDDHAQWRSGTSSSVAGSDLSLQSHRSGASYGTEINASRYGRPQVELYYRPEHSNTASVPSVNKASIENLLQETEAIFKNAKSSRTFECPAYWLGCPFTSSNFSELVVHSMVHFSLTQPHFHQLPAPYTCKCIVKGCEKTFHSSRDNRAWIHFTKHLAKRHQGPLPKTKPDYVPNFAFFEYLWHNRLIGSQQYQDLMTHGCLGSEVRPALTYNDADRERRIIGLSRQRADANAGTFRFNQPLDG